MSESMEFQPSHEFLRGDHACLLRDRSGRVVVKLNETSTGAELAPILNRIMAEYDQIRAQKPAVPQARLVS